MDSRKLVHSTLEFKNTTGTVPRQLWVLPWANEHYPNEVAQIQLDFPSDFGDIPNAGYTKLPKTIGACYEIGEYIDEWGCKFNNVQKGVIGQVKEPINLLWQVAALDHLSNFSLLEVPSSYISTL